MNRFKTMIALAVLALWLPATNHCRLELIPGLDFLSCCTHEETPADSHHEDDCETDSCATVESSLYKTEGRPITVVAPVLVLLDFFSSRLEILEPSRTACPVTPETLPPELPRTWQFALRAAMPPRAPSLAS